MNDYLRLSGKTVLVFGVANRKSVAWLIAKTLEEQGATVLYSVRSEARKKSKHSSKRFASDNSTRCEAG